MAHIKLFEVTVKYFVCTDTKERAEEEILRRHGDDYTSMKLKEIKAGLTCTHPDVQEENLF